MYKFRFDNCDKILQLTEEEIRHIPYLLTLISHKDDFLSMKNDDDEYMLHYPICYNLLIPMLNTMNNKKPYSLFNDLSINENIFDVFELFDYLCINQINNLNRQNGCFIYRRRQAKNLCEVRNKAARFVLSLAENGCDLNDWKTIVNIFSSISVIFSNRNIFSSQFRYHTYTILQEYVFPLFFKNHPIYLLNDIKQNYKIDSKIYLYDDNQSVPNDFQNDFLWISYYEPVPRDYQCKSCIGKSIIQKMLCRDHPEIIEIITVESYLLSDRKSRSSVDDPIDTNYESQLARLGCFNSQQRIKFDKFKYKYKTKLEKYR